MSEQNKNENQQVDFRKAPRGARVRPSVENPGKILQRLAALVFKRYGFAFAVVLVCILVSAWATLQGTLFLRTLIDQYITPMLSSGSRDFAPLVSALIKISWIYLAGVVSSFLYQRIMVIVTQGTLRNLRQDLFSHMETLPIRYFDQNAHGDIMSVYTNDVDTLRQLISQSIPQIVNSAVTLVMTFVSMILLSWQLTIVSVAMVAVTLFVSARIGACPGSTSCSSRRTWGARTATSRR